MYKLNLFLAALAFCFIACKQSPEASNTASTATVPSTTSTSVSAPTPLPATSNETPAALSKYELLKLPFKLDKDLAEGDLDQLGWVVGSKKLIKTSENFYAILHCLNIADDDITFELYGVDKNDALVGKKREIVYLRAIASAESVAVTSGVINIDNKNVIIDITDSENEAETTSSKSFVINANGVD
jgi:hypothetical protein